MSWDECDTRLDGIEEEIGEVEEVESGKHNRLK